jgi:predicted transcriptional regulator
MVRLARMSVAFPFIPEKTESEIKEILTNGASVLSLEILTGTTDPAVFAQRSQDGKGILHFACEKKCSIDILRFLVNITPDAVDHLTSKFQRPVDIACEQDQDTEVIRLLMPSINIDTLPTMKRMFGHRPVLLLEHISGESPLKIAEQQEPRDEDVINYLTDASESVAIGLIDVALNSRTDVPPLVAHLNNAIATSLPNLKIQRSDIVLSERVLRSRLDSHVLHELINNDALQGLLKDASFHDLVDGFSKMNKAGRKLALENTEDKLKSVQVLTSVLNFPDCLFSHLRENPSLCERGEQPSASESDSDSNSDSESDIDIRLADTKHSVAWWKRKLLNQPKRKLVLTKYELVRTKYNVARKKRKFA